MLCFYCGVKAADWHSVIFGSGCRLCLQSKLEEFMASQGVIPGVKPVAQYEVPYQFVLNGKKRSASVIVQADSPDGAIVQARIVLKNTGPVRFGKPFEFLYENL